jgi:four helix bundle protein
MGVKHFQDLAAWQLARELERQVFAFTAALPPSRDFEYCRQIRKASSSAPRNIAEGFGRFWPGDFARFVRNARGSLKETRDHLDAGLERGYLEASVHAECVRLANRALGASTRLAVYLEEAAETWSSKRALFRRRKNREPEP